MIALAAIALCAASVAVAETHLVLMPGGFAAAGDDARSYAYQIGYRRALDAAPNTALEFSVLNEGHLAGHRRDGFALQAWRRIAPDAGPLTLAVGVGPYVWFDTRPDSVDGHRNAHGLGALASVALRWQPDRRWQAELRLNRTFGLPAQDSTTLLAGIGWRLEPGAPSDPGADHPPATATTRDDTSAAVTGGDAGHQLSLGIGRSVFNSLNAETATAWQASYRHRLDGPFALSVDWLDEGSGSPLSRRGPGARLWLVHRPADGLEFGAGAGPYFGQAAHADPRQPVPARVAQQWSVEAGWRIGRQRIARLGFSRIRTRDNHDADVFLVSIGQSF